MSGRGSGGSPSSLLALAKVSVRGSNPEQGGVGGGMDRGVTNRHGVGWRHTKTNIQGSEDPLGWDRQIDCNPRQGCLTQGFRAMEVYGKAQVIN